MPNYDVEYEEITVPNVADWIWYREGNGHFERENDNEIVLKGKPISGYGIGALQTSIILPTDLKPLDKITIIWRFEMYKMRGVGDAMRNMTRLISFNSKFLRISEEHVAHNIPTWAEYIHYPTTTHFRDFGPLNDYKLHLRLDHVASNNSIADHIGNDKITVNGVKVFVERSNDAFSALLGYPIT